MTDQVELTWSDQALYPPPNFDPKPLGQVWFTPIALLGYLDACNGSAAKPDMPIGGCPGICITLPARACAASRKKRGRRLCNLYNLTSARDAVGAFTKALIDKAGWNEPSIDVYPNMLAPIVRVGTDGQREIVRANWGMPTPSIYLKGKAYDPGITNIRQVDSSWWRRWLGPASRCVVPFNAFAEPNSKRQRPGERVPNAWFAQNPDRPLMFFAGVWTPWSGVKKVRDGEREFELFGILTTEPNEIVKPIHFKAMPAILTTPDDVDLWLTGRWEDVRHLQRPLPDAMLILVDPPDKTESGALF